MLLCCFKRLMDSVDRPYLMAELRVIFRKIWAESFLGVNFHDVL